MRPLRLLGIYIAVVFLGGALLAPWLYWLVQSMAETFPELAREPFHRYVNRSLLALALIGLFPLLKALGATSPRDIGLTRPSGQWKNLMGGFLLGFLSLALLAGAALMFGPRDFRDEIEPVRLVRRLGNAALTAVVVSVLEEILFRGALFGSLRKVFHWVLALVLSSMIYALVHFMESARATGPIEWYSGLQLLPQMLRGFGVLDAVIPGFFNLTAAGMLLGLAYQRTGTLYFPIGLHAGWIFWLKSYGLLTSGPRGVHDLWWGTAKLINGWAALPVLAAVLLAFSLLPMTRKREQPAL
ncbi:MAG TPA: CPBP family intramembrane metalloprotease [Verrucomicrobia bacterium]|nr:CPBP family intramembrane metalloprotease [Verrucomicrobiota bacterium]HOB31906.1 CPBP family intramembrane metalloprotease [Verrucomicrobiota bacterium]HOP98058.1 CPBP family intramembrane metalloprotease [Verrucomicrobiota bacterium]HPU55976.1 CPBP family intramembrane metalloprotease [Verrucomicrobiota bacterium]